MNVIYSVVKSYKGIFKKKHSGNVHLLIVPTGENQFSTFIIIGKLKQENNTYALQYIGSGPINYVKNFLEEFGLKQKGLVEIERLPCSISGSYGNYNCKINKKGEYILSDFNLEYKPEFSSDNSKMFFLKGKLNPILDTEGVNNKQMKMVALKKTSILSAIKNKFKKDK